jgi:hypothetical protein
MADLDAANASTIFEASSLPFSIVSDPSVPPKKRAGSGKKCAPKVELTAIAKKWQAILSYQVVCKLFESGKQLTKENQQSECMIYYQAILPDFINKVGFWSSVTEYNSKEFSLSQMMLSSGQKTMDGKTVISKGKAVRKDLVKWLASMKDNDNAAFTKAFSFEKLKMATSEEEEKADAAGTKPVIEGTADISWQIASGTSALDAANNLLVAIYNIQQASIITIDEDDSDEPITDIDGIPAKYFPPIEYILIKYFVILTDSLGIDKDNYLCICLSDCYPGASSSVTRGEAISGSLIKKSRNQIKQEAMQKKENARVGNASLRGEDNDSTKILAQANAEYHLLSNGINTQLTFLNMSKEMHIAANDLDSWNKQLMELMKRSAEITANYTAIVDIENKKRSVRESKANESAHITSKRMKSEKNSEFYNCSTPVNATPQTSSSISTGIFSRGVLSTTSSSLNDNNDPSSSSDSDNG